jgi:copper homeostasis protein
MSTPMPLLLECVVETVAAARAAEHAGAARLELCSRLADGGVTPPAGLVTAVLERVSIPVFVMVRPRPGDFVYSEAEMADALHDVAAVRMRGAHGIVLGVLQRDARVDVDRTRSLIDRAAGLPVTFHRAFDAAPDLGAALEDIIAAGARRVLTSGGAATALDGVDRLAALVRKAQGRVTVLAGGGVRAHNVQTILERSGVSEVHARFEDEPSTRALADLL